MAQKGNGQSENQEEYESIRETFGKNLRKIRQERDMTQEQLADMVGISKSSISFYETTTKCPTLTNAQLLASKLDTPLYKLCGVSVNAMRPVDALMYVLEIFRFNVNVEGEKHITLDVSENQIPKEISRADIFDFFREYMRLQEIMRGNEERKSTTFDKVIEMFKEELCKKYIKLPALHNYKFSDDMKETATEE